MSGSYDRLIKPEDATHYRSINTDKEPASSANIRQESCSCFPTRYAVILISFFAYNLAFLLRANLSVALVKMVNSSHTSGDPNENVSEQCHYSGESNNSWSEEYHNTEGEFDWNEKLQGIVLCSFVSTFGFGGLFGGRLAEKLGSKKIMGGSICTLSVLTLLSPLAAKLSIYALIIVRLLEGFMAGMVMPTMNTVVSRWMPKSERSIGVSVLLGGTRFGNVMGSLVTGFLCKSPLLNGWPLTFYVFGSLGLIWTVAWIFIMYETPSEHPRISHKELDFILKNQGQEKAKKNVKIPYRAILTSVPVWATVFANIGESWGMSTLPINLPLYFAHILHFDVQLSGLLAAMPSLLQAVFMWCSGILADCIIRSGRVNRTVIRKAMNSIGQLLAAACLVGATFVGCDRTANVVLLTLTLGLNGFVAAGFRPSLIDMAPDFAGSIMGLTVFVGNTIGFVSPFIIGLLTNHNQTLERWHIVFWINAAFYSFGGLSFLLGGSSELQSWGLAKETGDQANGAPPEEREEKPHSEQNEN